MAKHAAPAPLPDFSNFTQLSAADQQKFLMQPHGGSGMTVAEAMGGSVIHPNSHPDWRSGYVMSPNAPYVSPAMKDLAASRPPMPMGFKRAARHVYSEVTHNMPGTRKLIVGAALGAVAFSVYKTAPEAADFTQWGFLNVLHTAPDRVGHFVGSKTGEFWHNTWVKVLGGIALTGIGLHVVRREAPVAFRSARIIAGGALHSAHEVGSSAAGRGKKVGGVAVGAARATGRAAGRVRRVMPSRPTPTPPTGVPRGRRSFGGGRGTRRKP